MSPWISLLTALVLFIAGVNYGLTGFGFALISVPVLVIFMPPKVVIPMVMLQSTLVAVFILWEARRWIDLRRIWILVVTAIIGMPFGAYILKVVDADRLRVIIGVFIVLFAFAFLQGFRRKSSNEKAAFIPIGFFSGLLNGSIGMSGPPVILFFANQGVHRDAFRANLVAYFMMLNIATIPVFVYHDIITLETIKYGGIYMLPMLVGVYIGVKLAGKADETLFRKIALIIVTVAGLFSIISGVGIFW